MPRKMLISIFALTALLGGSLVRAQVPAGFELALVSDDGTKTVIGQLPPSVYAPRVSPDGKRVAFETRDLFGPDGPRLWTAELSNIAGRKVLPLVPRVPSSRCGRSTGSGWYSPCPANAETLCIGAARTAAATPNI